MGNITSAFTNATETSEDLPVSLFGSHDYLLKYWKELNVDERQQLVEQFKSIEADNAVNAFHDSIMKQDFAGLEPIPDDRHIVSRKLPLEELKSYWNKGLEAIAHGKVAALALAGGQASRLGVSVPKGVLPLDLDSESDCNTLFALQAYRIARLQNLARKEYPEFDPVIPWYIMVSASTYNDTSDYLKRNVEKFGLLADNIHIFVQGQMPCFDLCGNFMLSNKAEVAMAPNGNGGIYAALAPYLKSMRANGIEYVHVYCVDNILCKVADPYFIGFGIAKNVDCAAKVVEKTDPDESVGLFCQQNGKVILAEYSEIQRDLTYEKTASGLLAFRAANIVNHLFSVDFLEKVCCSDCRLPYHQALKKIPYFDGEKVVKPNLPNGIKLEQFVTDAFGYANNFFLWEVDRENEFSPLKNANAAGKDCLSTCQRDLFAESKRWLKESGAVFDENLSVFVHPLKSYHGEGLEDYHGEIIQTRCVR